jgi:Arc/MetJ-type ribon-helix-helix transcriptional regulator
MEAISLKLDASMLQAIDSSLKSYHYGTRTEFVRDAIREKLEDLQRGELAREFLRLRGKAGKRTSAGENRRTRERAGKELFAELESRFR